jgi:hypothetical protein
MPANDLVVFRRWRDGGDIIALFVEVPADLRGQFCQSYEHFGQHGGADYHGVIQQTLPVKPEDCTDLAEELTRIGYELRVIQRASLKHHDRRRQIARHFAVLTPTNPA